MQHRPAYGSRTRHTKEDALSDREFELLVEASQELDPYFRLPTKFVAFVGGRLGLRRGEISHMQRDWVDFRDQMIHVPPLESCDCGHCKQMARQEAKHSETGKSVETCLSERWKPKTEAAVRDVPFGFDARTTLVVERFFDHYGEFPYSGQTINRYLKRAAEQADELDPETTYPHCLRSTAASYHAGKGLGVIPLQAMFGWADISTALNYVRQSGENTSRALKMVHSR